MRRSIAAAHPTREPSGFLCTHRVGTVPAMLRRALHAFAMFVVFGLVSCGRGGTLPTFDGEEGPVSLLPGDTRWFAWLDLDAVRRVPFYDIVEADLGASFEAIVRASEGDPDNDAVAAHEFASEGLEWTERVRWMLVAGPRPEPEAIDPDLVVLVGGELGYEDVRRLMAMYVRARTAGRRAPPEVQETPCAAGVCLAHGWLFVGQVSRGVWAFGAEARVRAVVAREGARLVEDHPLRRGLRHAEGSIAAVGGHFADPLDVVFPEVGRERDLRAFGASRGGLVQVRWRGGARLDARAFAPSAMGATALAERLDHELREYQTHPLWTLLGLGDETRAVHVSSEESDATLSLALSRTEALSLYSRTVGLVVHDAWRSLSRLPARSRGAR